MPILIVITVATLVGGGFLITTDPAIVADNQAKITASSTAQVKVTEGLGALKLKFKEWNEKHPKIAPKPTSTKATSTKATSTKVKIHPDASVEGRIKAAENFIASVRQFIEVHKAEISAEVKANAEAKLTTAANFLADAKAKLAADADAEAEALVKQSMGAAKEAKGIVQTDIRGEVKASSTVKIDFPGKEKCVVLLTYPPQIRCN